MRGKLLSSGRSRLLGIGIQSGGGVSGQMAVELAVLLPLLLVIGLIVYNLALFLDAVAAFDEIAPDAVIALGVSPEGSGADLSSVTSMVEAAITSALGRSATCEVTVTITTPDSGSASGASFLISPLQTRFICTLTYRIWPSNLYLGALSFSSPLTLSHSCELVVDRYRSGVLI